MNQNSMDYEFLTEVVSRDIKQLKMAITVAPPDPGDALPSTS